MSVHDDKMSLTLQEEISNFYDSDRSTAVDCTNVEFDGDFDWQPEKLASATLHDPDYQVFAHFTHPDEIGLDIGAHFGYSIASIWASGCACKLLSFEPNQAYAKSLRRLKQLSGGRSDYINTALGSLDCTASCFTPVLNGVALGALTSFDLHPDSRLIAEHLQQYALKYLNPDGPLHLSFCRSHVQVSKLDTLYATMLVRKHCNMIAFAKVDVEGAEWDVLWGAQQTIEAEKPLMLIENGPQRERVGHLLHDRGYVQAKRVDNHLLLAVDAPVGLNSFFLHRDKLVAYERQGLLH